MDPHFSTSQYLSRCWPLPLQPSATATTRMRGLRLAARILNAVRLFSFGSSQSENTAYLWPTNFPPIPAIDNDLPHERCSEAVRQLRPLFPSACVSFEPGEVEVVGDNPIAAGGFADIWEGTLDSHSIIQKSYRCYETCDVERIFRVRSEYFSRTAWFTLRFRDTSARCGCLFSSLT